MGDLVWGGFATNGAILLSLKIPSLNQLINHDAVCRTAPATQGQFKIVQRWLQVWFKVASNDDLFPYIH